MPMQCLYTCILLLHTCLIRAPQAAQARLPRLASNQQTMLTAAKRGIRRRPIMLGLQGSPCPSFNYIAVLMRVLIAAGPPGI